MRFSRFRQHMEGIPTNPRGPRAKKPKTEKSAAAAQAKKQAMFANDKMPDPTEQQAHIKAEPGLHGHGHGFQQQHHSPVIKQEPPVVDPLLTQYTYPPPMGPSSGYYQLHQHAHRHQHQHPHSPYAFGTVAPSDLTLQCPMPPPRPPPHAYGYPIPHSAAPTPTGEHTGTSTSTSGMVRIKTEPFESAKGVNVGAGGSSPNLNNTSRLSPLPSGSTSRGTTTPLQGEGPREIVVSVKTEPGEGS